MFKVVILHRHLAPSFQILRCPLINSFVPGLNDDSTFPLQHTFSSYLLAPFHDLSFGNSFSLPTLGCPQTWLSIRQYPSQPCNKIKNGDLYRIIVSRFNSISKLGKQLNSLPFSILVSPFQSLS